MPLFAEVLLTEDNRPILQENGGPLVIRFYQTSVDDMAEAVQMRRMKIPQYEVFKQKVNQLAQVDDLKIENGVIYASGAARANLLAHFMSIKVNSPKATGNANAFVGFLNIHAENGEVSAVGVKDISDEDLLLMILDL